MSKERAQRRADREREATIRASAHAAEAERLERLSARKQALTAWLPRGRSRPTGIIAERRRQQVALTIALLVVVNVLIWVFVPQWSARAMALVVSLLAAPVLHTMLFRR